jgi:hypothetical protein
MFVEALVGLEAVVELAEELDGQVSLGLVVPVSGGAAGIEVVAGAGRGAQRSQCPDGADGGEAPVLDVSVQHDDFLAAGPGDWCRSGVGLQAATLDKFAPLHLWDESAPRRHRQRRHLSALRPGQLDHRRDSQRRRRHHGRPHLTRRNLLARRQPTAHSPEEYPCQTRIAMSKSTLSRDASTPTG